MNVRVAALSPTLVRLERQGPRGFEDNTTFMVVNRTSFPMVPMQQNGGTFTTAFYTVVVTVDGSGGASATITMPGSAGPVWQGNLETNVSSWLQWPAPLSAQVYAIKDYPRFYVPPWGPSPASSSVDPALASTNGYDFRNDMDGDTYIFLLGTDLNGWHQSRKEFIMLTGATPLVPDFAFGTWFTWWLALVHRGRLRARSSAGITTVYR